MKKQPLTKALSIANLFGLILYVVIPLVLLLVFSVLLSAASVLDPLHAKSHVSSVWTSLAIVSGFQIVFSVFACTLTAIAVRQAAERVGGAAAYLLSAAVGLSIHWLLMALLGFPVYAVSRDELFTSFALLFAFFTTPLGTALGLICAAILNSNKLALNKAG